MSLLTYWLEYGRHLARFRRCCRRLRHVYAPTSKTASLDNRKKSIHGFPLLSYMGMGLHLADLLGDGARLQTTSQSF